MTILSRDGIEQTQATNPIIVALDVPSADQAVDLARELHGSVGAFKVGLELFNSEGPTIFDRLRVAAGDDIRIFYDAKLHDIPNTVAGAMAAAVKNRLWMINIHSTGGSAMMKAAVDVAHGAPGPRPLVIAVTLLTSIDAGVLNDEMGIGGAPKDAVVRLAKLAQNCGCDGVVASAHEIQAIRAACGPDFVIITPGVRPAGADLADQKRVMTPGEAVRAGSKYLVIGRPITRAENPRKAAEAIRLECESSLSL